MHKLGQLLPLYIEKIHIGTHMPKTYKNKKTKRKGKKEKRNIVEMGMKKL
jgi:hypothetical protein